MRHRHTFFYIFLWIFCLACSPETQKQEAVKPNILLFIAEDLSPDLGCYGNDLVNTPHLDALAGKGMKFTNALVVSPVCSPSRTALATGMYPTSLGAYHMRYPDELQPPLPESVRTMPQLFKENGYVSANIRDEVGRGKIDWLFAHQPEDHFVASSWKEIAESGKPFFTMLSTAATHRVFEQATEGQFPLDSIPIPPFYPDHAVTRADFANYYASIEKLDQQFGQVMDSLAHYGFAENTIVAFLGDHGRPMTRDKNYNYLSGLRVPMMVYIPPNLQPPTDYRPNSTENAIVSSIDLSATLLALANIPLPSYLQGQPFLGYVKSASRNLAFSATDRIGETHFKTRSIVDGRFHYIRNYHHDFSINSSATAYRKAHHPIYHLLEIFGEKGELTPPQQFLIEPLPEEELYDWQADPHEINNLAGQADFQAVLESKRNQMDSLLQAIGDKGLQPDSQEIIDAFAEYGERSRANYQEKINQLQTEVEQQIKNP